MSAQLAIDMHLLKVFLESDRCGGSGSRTPNSNTSIQALASSVVVPGDRVHSDDQIGVQDWRISRSKSCNDKDTSGPVGR